MKIFYIWRINMKKVFGVLLVFSLALVGCSGEKYEAIPIVDITMPYETDYYEK